MNAPIPWSDLTPFHQNELVAVTFAAEFAPFITNINASLEIAARRCASIRFLSHQPHCWVCELITDRETVTAEHPSLCEALCIALLRSAGKEIKL